MRQVRQKRSPRTATVRSSGRTKSVRRNSDARPQRRSKRGGGDDDGSTLRRWLASRFAVRHPMLSLTATLIIAAAAIGVFAGGHVSAAMASVGGSIDRTFASAGFGTARITLSGQSRTAANDVAIASGIKHGQSLFSVDPAVVRARLMQLPWVADAGVRRVYPDTVAVSLIEKRPYALWKNGESDSIVVVERSGAVITGAKSGEFRDLPLLVGDGAPKAAAALLDAIGVTSAVAARLKVAQRVADRRWNLILDGPVAVKLPEQGWEREIGTLERLIVQDGVLEKDIEVIDLRFADRYIFRLRNGDSRRTSRERPT